VKIALPAVFDHGDVRLHDRDLGARELLEKGERAGMIHMAVTIDRQTFPHR
jgi:hypothetical protein